MDKRYGIIFSDEGTDAAFEAGIIRAQLNQGNQAVMALGSSFGVLNALLVAQNDVACFERFWAEAAINPFLEMKAAVIQIFLSEWRDYEDEIFKESIFEGLFRGGIDVSSVYNVFQKYFDEDRLRGSGIDFGLVTYHPESLQPIVMTLDQIKAGELFKAVLMSIAVPACTEQLSGEALVRDSHLKNDLLFKTSLDYDWDVLFSLQKPGKELQPLFRNRSMICINKSEFLESLIPIKSETIQHDMLLGELDTQKALGSLTGRFFYFDLTGPQDFYQKFKAFFNDPDKDSPLWIKTALLLKIPIESSAEIYNLSIVNALKRTTYSKNTDVLINLMEITGRLLNVERCRCYSLDEFLYSLLLRIEELTQNNIDLIQNHAYWKGEALVFSNMYMPVNPLDFVTFYYIFVQNITNSSPGYCYQIIKHTTPEFALAMLLLLKLHEISGER